MTGLARAMARMAQTRPGYTRSRPQPGLSPPCAATPNLSRGEGRACTALIRAMSDGVVKTGAEGVFTAILPARGLGIAIKIADGTTRAAEATIAALLVGAGVLDPGHPLYGNRIAQLARHPDRYRAAGGGRSPARF